MESRSLWRAGSLETVTSEMVKYNLDPVAVQERDRKRQSVVCLRGVGIFVCLKSQKVCKTKHDPCIDSVRYHILFMSRDSSVGAATGLRDRVRFLEGLGISLFTVASRTSLGTDQPPIQWVPEAFPLRVGRPGRDADHSPPSSAEVKE
jgi:hypothetical protein